MGPHVSTEVALLPDERVMACAAPSGVDVADSSSAANDKHRVDRVVPAKGIEATILTPFLCKVQQKVYLFYAERVNTLWFITATVKLV